MHSSVYNWVGSIVAQLDLAELPTLEVGSCNVNGGVRDHFTGTYLGVDFAAGPGVDEIVNAENLDEVTRWGECPFAVVVSTEMLEHVERPWLCVQAMADALEPGGHLILTCRGFDGRGAFAQHEYPADHYRFSDGAMRVLVEDAGLLLVELVADPHYPGWFVLAVKPTG